MKVEVREGGTERKVLTAMLVDHSTLAAIAARWEPPGLFGSSWCNLFGKWAVDYFERYGKPPRKIIESLFSTWAEKAKGKKTVELAGEFLSSLGGKYKTLAAEVNSAFMIDLAGRHFNKVKLKRLADSIYSDLTEDDVDHADDLVQKYGKVSLGVGAGIDVMRDQEAMRRALEARQEPLLRYKHKDGLGKFYGHELTRDAFLLFMASNKRGKSWMLLDMAWECVLNRLKVAYFQAGDLSEGQILVRFMTRAARHPVFAGKVQYPTAITLEKDDDQAYVDYKTINYKEKLDWRKANTCFEEIIATKLRTDDTLLKLSVHPNYTLSYVQLRSILQGWEREGWSPDVVCLDSPDLLMPPTHFKDERSQTNYNYSNLRGLSQSLHCLLVGTTQANAKSFGNPWVLTRQHFSEDNRKLAHVTSCFGINQTNAEKEQQVVRLNVIVGREYKFIETQCCYVAQCLELANPAVKSYFPY